MQSGLQPGTAGLPAQIRDTAFSEARGLHPLQHVASALAVVTDEPGIPQEEKCACHDHVDENKTAHGAPEEKSYFLSMQVRKGRRWKKRAHSVAGRRPGDRILRGCPFIRQIRAG